MRRIMAGALAASMLTAAQPARADTVADWWDYAGKIANPSRSTRATASRIAS